MEGNAISKIQNYDDTILPSLSNFLSRQQDNDDANDDENDIDIFPGQTNRTYEIPQREQFIHHESIQTVNYSQLNYFYFLFQLQ